MITDYFVTVNVETKTDLSYIKCACFAWTSIVIVLVRDEHDMRYESRIKKNTSRPRQASASSYKPGGDGLYTSRILFGAVVLALSTPNILRRGVKGKDTLVGSQRV